MEPMKSLSLSFHSEGERLEAALFLPRPSPVPAPTVIALSGYQGFLAYYPTLFAKYLTARGFAVFGFDYRGFGRSGGRQGRVTLDEQRDDAINAVHFLHTRPEVDAGRLAVIGWGMGASHAIRAAAADPRLRAVGALNGFFHGANWLRALLGAPRFDVLRDHVARDRSARVLSGKSERVDPFLYYPLDPATAEDVKLHLQAVPGFGRPVEMQFFESVLGLDALRETDRLAGRRVFVAHGTRNKLHPPAESEALLARLDGPKEFHPIDGDHNGFMHEGHPEMNRLMDRLAGFLGDALETNASR
jgi:fermentation-respiration switch protein FrsA (DUF1100 family)